MRTYVHKNIARLKPLIVISALQTMFIVISLNYFIKFDIGRFISAPWLRYPHRSLYYRVLLISVILVSTFTNYCIIKAALNPITPRRVVAYQLLITTLGFGLSMLFMLICTQIIATYFSSAFYDQDLLAFIFLSLSVIVYLTLCIFIKNKYINSNPISSIITISNIIVFVVMFLLVITVAEIWQWI